MLHVADTDAALERARDRGARVQREPYENYGARNATHHRPVRPPLDAQRSGHRRARSRSSTVTSATSRCGRPTPIAPPPFYGHVLGWTYDPDTHQVTNTQQHIGIFAVGGPPNLFCCYAVADLEGARQAILDGGGTGRRGRAVRLRHRARCHRPAGQRRSPSSSRRRASRAPSSTALGQANFRTSPTRWPTRRHSRRSTAGVLFWTFEPGPDRGRLAGAADPSDGRGRGRQRRSR